MSGSSGCDTGEITTTADDRKLPVEIWVLIGAAFVIAIGFGLVAPVLPQFARSFGVGFTAASAIISAFALMRLLFAPFSGALVQRLGERWVYLSGLGIVAVSTGLCALSQTYWQLLVLRSLGGIGSTMFTVSSLALVIRLSPFHQRGRVSGLWSSSFLIGSVSGPLVGGALAGLGLRVPFVIYAAALLLACAIVYVSLRDSHLAAPETGERAPELTFRQGLAEPAYPAMLWSNFANGVAVFGVRMAFVPLIVVETLGQSPGMAGVALTAFAVGNVLVLFQAGRLSDRFGRRPFLVAGALVCGVGTAGLGFAPDLLWLLAASVVAGIGSGMLTPTQQAALADVVGSQARSGPVLAGFQMAGDLGAVIGPVVAGVLIEHFGYAVGLSATGALLLVAAVAWLAVPETLRRTDEHVHTGEPASVPIDDDEYQLAHRAAVEHLPEESPSRTARWRRRLHRRD